MTSEEKRTLIKQYVSAYNDFDIDTLMNLIHPQVSFSNISNGKVNAEAEGLEAFRELAERSCNVFRSRNQAITSYLFNGNNAVVGFDYDGVLAKDLPTGQKAGEHLHLTCKTEFNFEGGKLKRIIDHS